jgi:hypothetical protein
MSATFGAAAARLGERGGYLAGFGAYWLSCAVLAVGILGPGKIRRLFGDRRPRLGKPAALGALLLLWPAVGAITTRFLPEIGEATALMVTTAVAVALVNAVLEELLWRGVYITLWPSNPLLGWVWPAIGFGLWHLAPQIIHPSAIGPVTYVAAAMALGLSWGWVAWRSGSLRWVSVSHLATDASGLPNALFFLAS